MNEHERNSIRSQFRIAAALALGTITIGTVFYHHIEHMRYIDAFYFSVISLATVGYGDFAPHTDIGKLFTVAYVLSGIGIIATFANLLVKNAVANRQYNQAHKKRQ